MNNYPIETTIIKDLIKRKTGEKPVSNEPDGMILEFYYDLLIAGA